MALSRNISRSIAALVSRMKTGAGEGVRILTYHRVSGPPGDRLSVSPAEFRKQMDYLRSTRCRVVSLSRLFDLKTFTPPPVVLTFDDGYRDFFKHAFPVLREYGFPAAVFIVPGFIDGTFQPEDVRLEPGSRPLTWDMLAEAAAAGITIGSHSLSHRQLTDLSPARAAEEIKESGRIIKDRLGTRPAWFSYPRGKYNRSIAALVEESGYRGAVTVRPGLNRPPFQYFALRRTEISGDDNISDFSLKLAGGFDLVHSLWQKFRGDRL